MNQTDPHQRYAGRYRVDRLLGQGGMGKVYLAHDTLLENEQVALKILHRDLCEDESQMRRFLREVQVTRRITHPNVVRTFDVGMDNGALFMTMELIQGSSLREYALERVLAPQEITRILLEIARGLEAIHGAGVIHRDLKPANVLIANDGTIRVTDFGVAREQRSTLTSPNELIGSAVYMAPELWRGEQASVQTDLYAFGVLAYEICTGKAPYEGESPAEVMAKHLAGICLPPQQLRSDLPGWLNTLILLLMSPDPTRRPKSATHTCQVLTSGMAQFTKAAEHQRSSDEQAKPQPPPAPKTTVAPPKNLGQPKRSSLCASPSPSQLLAPSGVAALGSEVSPDSQRARARRRLFDGNRKQDDDDQYIESVAFDASGFGRRGAARTLLAFAFPATITAAMIYGLAVDLAPGTTAWWGTPSATMSGVGNILRLLAPPITLTLLWLLLMMPLTLAAFSRESFPFRFLLRTTLLPLTLFCALVVIDGVRLGLKGGFISSTYSAIKMRGIVRQNTEKVVRVLLLTPIGRDTVLGEVKRAEVRGVAERAGVAITSRTGAALDLRLQEDQRKLDLGIDMDRNSFLERPISLAGVPVAYLLLCGSFAGLFLHALARDWFGSASGVGSRLMPVTVWVLGGTLTFELFARDLLLPLLPAQVGESFDIPFWFFPLSLDGYSVGCAMLNWGLLLVQLILVAPRLEAD